VSQQIPQLPAASLGRPGPAQHMAHVLTVSSSMSVKRRCTSSCGSHTFSQTLCQSIV
jgi:hypothetical protein